MPKTFVMSWDDVTIAAERVVGKILLYYGQFFPRKTVHIYGIPRGGVYAAQAVAAKIQSPCFSGHFGGVRLVTDPDEAEVFVDDIIDSGKTRDKYEEKYGVKVFALYDKLTDESFNEGQWVSFPWERMNDETAGIEDAVRRMIQFIGDDPDREGLCETPKRVAKSYGELFRGYSMSPADIMKVFEEGACDEMVVLRDIEFSSTCEHHLLPFIGTATVGYIPNGKVIGVSKLARLVDIFARRLQIQEKLTEQVTSALMDHLAPKGAGCIIQAQHLCMSCRGVSKSGSKMITSSLTGVFRDGQVRSEFLNFAR